MIDMVDLFNACLYIQDHLDADLSLLFLAQTVGLSRFRFHRVFKAWRGETLHDFVTRMRMERAAFELAYPIPRSSRRSIKAIAFASGYKSLSSFSHAFSSYSNLSPREFRNRALRERPRTETSPGTDLSGFSISVSHQPERRIAVLEPHAAPRDPLDLVALSRLANAAPMEGERFGVELLPDLLARTRHEGRTPAAVKRLCCVGVGLDDWLQAPRQSRHGRGAPRTTIRLDAGRYAVVEGRGSLAAVYRAWRRGFDGWLAASGECPKAGRVYVRFGPDRSGNDAGEGTVALYIPLEEVYSHAARAPRALRPMPAWPPMPISA
jgi:AraC-like DNA-binding protein